MCKYGRQLLKNFINPHKELFQCVNNKMNSRVSPNENRAKDLFKKQVIISEFILGCSDQRFAALVQDFLCGYKWQIKQPWNNIPCYDHHSLFFYSLLYRSFFEKHSQYLNTPLSAIALEYGFFNDEIDDIIWGFGKFSIRRSIWKLFRTKQQKNSKLYEYSREFYNILVSKTS